MRAANVPWLNTPDELTQYIGTLTDRPHDYGTCVYAMSMAATAAMQYVANKLGTTGFQASCADLDIVRRSRMIDGPFAIIKARDGLYPQYGISARVSDLLANWRPWLAEQARAKLAELASGDVSAHPDVVAHWQKLAESA